MLLISFHNVQPKGNMVQEHQNIGHEDVRRASQHGSSGRGAQQIYCKIGDYIAATQSCRTRSVSHELRRKHQIDSYSSYLGLNTFALNSAPYRNPAYFLRLL